MSCCTSQIAWKVGTTEIKGGLGLLHECVGLGLVGALPGSVPFKDFIVKVKVVFHHVEMSSLAYRNSQLWCAIGILKLVVVLCYPEAHVGVDALTRKGGFAPSMRGLGLGLGQVGILVYVDVVGSSSSAVS